MFALALPATPAHSATNVSLDGTTLRIRDTTGDANALSVTSSARGYDIYDDVADLAPGPNCDAVRRHHVFCGVTVRVLSVDAGGGDDYVIFNGIDVPVAVNGGEGDDFVEGGPGGDQLEGGPGNDNAVGRSGNDGLIGDDGDDLLTGGTGGDGISAGEGADVLEGLSGNGDALVGGEGPDLLKGGSGNDSLRGGPGSDVLVTGTGTDKAIPGTGEDQIFGTTSDKVTCGADDEVSTGKTPAPAGCASLPSTAKVPDVWPPPTPGSPDAALGATPAASALAPFVLHISYATPLKVTNVKPINRGKATNIGLKVKSGNISKLVCVEIRTFSKKNKQLKRFRKKVKTKNPTAVPTRGSRAVYRAQVKLLQGKPCK